MMVRQDKRLRLDVRSWLPLQPVAATHALDLSAGVLKSNVFLGRSLRRRATLFRCVRECMASHNWRYHVSDRVFAPFRLPRENRKAVKAASFVEIDAVIDPGETREVILNAFHAADIQHWPRRRRFVDVCRAGRRYDSKLPE